MAMNTVRLGVLSGGVALLLSACSVTSSPTPPPTREANLEASDTYYVSVENSLGPIGDTSAPKITWKVTDTKNEFWDGKSRPDNPPPNGLQGLEQQSGSGAVKVRTEVNDRWFASQDTNFLLTPTIHVGDQTIDLQSFLFLQNPLAYDYWEVSNSSKLSDPNFVLLCRSPFVGTAETSAGTLSYTVKAECSNSKRMTSLTVSSAS